MYENLVVTEYNRQVGVKFDDDALLDMRVICYYPIAKNVSKKKRELMLKGKLRPAKKPDVNNVVKVIADSLNNVAYRDDKQIVDCIVSKYYSDNPRVEISIKTVETVKYIVKTVGDGGGHMLSETLEEFLIWLRECCIKYNIDTDRLKECEAEQ